MSPFFRFFRTVLFIVLLIVGGTAGYTLLEGWSYLDSLYMTVITITTVGFQEVHTLSPAGKYLTMVIIMLSIANLGYFVSIFISFVFEGQLMKEIKERKMRRTVKKLKDHYIVCGCGDIGREVAFELKKARERFIIIDLSPETSELARDESILFLKGDAAEDEVLLEAGVLTAKGLISALPGDETNAFVVLSARQLNPRLIIVTQAREDRNVNKLLKSGANRVISPKEIAGKRLSALLLHPSVVSFLDVVMGADNISLRMEEIRIEKKSPVIGKTLRELGIGEKTGAIIVSISDAELRPKVNPAEAGKTNVSFILIEEGDNLIAFGNETQLGMLKDLVKKPGLVSFIKE